MMPLSVPFGLKVQGHVRHSFVTGANEGFFSACTRLFWLAGPSKNGCTKENEAARWLE